VSRSIHSVLADAAHDLSDDTRHRADSIDGPGAQGEVAVDDTLTHRRLPVGRLVDNERLPVRREVDLPAGQPCGLEASDQAAQDFFHGDSVTERARDLKPPLYTLQVPGPYKVCRTCDCLVFYVRQGDTRVCADCGQAWRYDAPVVCKCGATRTLLTLGTNGDLPPGVRMAEGSTPIRAHVSESLVCGGCHVTVMFSAWRAEGNAQRQAYDRGHRGFGAGGTPTGGRQLETTTPKVGSPLPVLQLS